MANYYGNSITVYSRTASGSTVPRRTIRTGVITPLAVLLDPLHGEVYVANATNGSARIGSVQVYDWFANYPQDTPKRTIAGPDTGLVASEGLALDLLRNELFVANDDAATITVYPRTANGDVSPTRVIAGPNTSLDGPLSVTLDLIHDELIVINKVNYQGNAGLITVYPRSANGNVAPIRTIGGSLSTFNLPVHMDLDLLHNEIIVANAFSNDVLVFNRTDSGNVAPKRTLGGPNTDLCMPFAVISDIVNDELVVANGGFNPGCEESITVYSRAAASNTAPKRLLDFGPSGGPPNPAAIAQTILSLN